MLANLIDLYMLIVVASIVVSWVSVPRDNPIVVIIERLTAPVLGPARKLIPPLGPLDLSPAAVLFGLSMLRRLVD